MAWAMAVVLGGCAVAALVACTGEILVPGSEAGSDDGARPGAAPLRDPAGLGPSAIRRLSRAEYRDTLRDLLGIDPGADVELLPEDALTPFDNDATTQVPSAALVEALKAIADRAAERVVADPELRARLVECTPRGPDDEECLRTFIARFGRRALRRPLRDEEITEYTRFQRFAVEDGDFYTAVGMVIRAMLQDMELVYRIELGTPVAGRPGVFRLDDWEVASRLSYFLWGSAPDDQLLDRAAAGQLRTSAQVRAAAERMLDDPRAAAQVARFHALWLGYERIPLSADLASAMRRESDALVERVTMQRRSSWYELFESDQTYVSDMLAEHYGLEPPGSAEPQWVDYGDSGRQGILSHGSFLSNGAKLGDTSPTLRGLVVRRQVLCEEIPPPPPTVNTDEPPMGDSADDCKYDRYAMHREGACASCHEQMDPIGFGLENYDHEGRFRVHDDGRPECTIAGEGEVVGLGTFEGPAGLADLLTESGRLGPCATRQLFRFAMGRPDRRADAPAIDALGETFTRTERFHELLLAFVSSEGLRYRVVEEE